MKRKFISLILALSLALSLCPAALADDTRETDFFEDQPHTDKTFEEIEYEAMEAGPLVKEMEELRALSKDKANEKALSEKFDALTGELMKLQTMSSLAQIRFDLNASDEALNAESLRISGERVDAVDAFSSLCRDILASPCAAFLEAQLSEEDLEYYREYEDMTEEQKARQDKIDELVNAYDVASLQTFTVEYEGQTYDESAAIAAYRGGSIDQKTYISLLNAIGKKQNEVLGGYYMELLPLRQEEAAEEGYGNYAGYSYEEVYDRDYTPEEIRTFFQSVKENMVETNSIFSALSNAASADPVFSADYTGEETLDLVEGYFGQMSSELAETFAYMRGHKFYDLGDREGKTPGGYTTALYTYGAPFMFNKPNHNLYDFTTLVHEFGHYNNFYWQPLDWNDPSDTIDVAEVHSQGMELLFSHYYPEIFGDSTQAVSDYLMNNLTGSIVQGCWVAELEQFAFETEDVTLEQINEKFAQLSVEYGFVPEGHPLAEYYGYIWATIPHMFQSPCYYISYATSAAGAFNFWLAAQEGEFLDVVDEYLKFVALPADMGITESFEAVEMRNPLAATTIADLSGELLEKTGALDRYIALALAQTFVDMGEPQWYNEAVYNVVAAGLMSGSGDGDDRFNPDGEVTWGQALKVLLRMAGATKQPAVSEDAHWASGYLAMAWALGLAGEDQDLDAAITRQELAKLICTALEIPASEGKSPYTDTQDGYVTALAEAGVLDGFTGEETVTEFKGGSSLTRAQLCQIIYNALLLAAGDAA